MNTFLKIGIIVFVLTVSSVGLTYAHVTVKPNSVGVAAYQTFTVSVPVEKEQPTTNVKLVIPEGLQSVTPNVKPGWTIVINKSGEGEEAKVTEVEWQGGNIPAGQRDEFIFSSKTPSTPTELHWKAYQTYKDGTVVSWDMDPKMDMDHNDENIKDAGPYSVTKVIDDLSTPTPVAQTVSKPDGKLQAGVAVALALSAVSLLISLTRRSS